MATFLRKEDHDRGPGWGKFFFFSHPHYDGEIQVYNHSSESMVRFYSSTGEQTRFAHGPSGGFRDIEHMSSAIDKLISA